jgi:hypothetical protein
MDETFATLLLRGLRKLPMEEVEGALASLVQELNRQASEQKAAQDEEPKEVEVIE